MPAHEEGRHDTLLASYVIASGEMYCFEECEREIYLRHDASGQPIVRGELPECCPDCYAPLGEVLLEYVMSCEGCRDTPARTDSIDHFCARLGSALVAQLLRELPTQAPHDRLASGLVCLLRSMDVPYIQDVTPQGLRFRLEHNPLREAARNIGIGRGMDLAEHALAALLRATIDALAPDWTLSSLQGIDADAPLAVAVRPAHALETDTHRHAV